MKKSLFARSIIIAGMAVLFLFSNTLWAYWVWTPGTKKFINPKNAVKDTPKEQFEWGMTFYNSKDYQRASTEFEKLTKQYEYSEYASRAQYYVGLCYENMNKLYIAFQNYQKAVDNFPHIENMDEIIAREFNIANMLAEKESPKVVGTAIMTSLDRAIEIYKRVVENAPYGRLAEEAQFRMGSAMKKAERYDEAIQAFQKILDDYPTSKFVDKSKFEVADCAYKASLKPAYDVEPTERAIKAFEDFNRENKDRGLTKEADKTIQRLKDKAAEKSLLTAQFYEKLGRYQSAVIYYKDIIDNYSGSSFVNVARSKITSLTAKLERTKAKSAPLDFTKPAIKPAKEKVVASVPSPKKKTWAPLDFSRPAKPKETVSEAQSEAKPQGHRRWAPFDFTKPSKPKETASSANAAPESAKPASGKGWVPLDFTKPAIKPAKEKVVASVPSPKKNTWAPLDFSRPAKPKETVSEAQSEEKPQGHKRWAPLDFTKSKRPVSAAEPAPEIKVAESPVLPVPETSSAVNTVPSTLQKPGSENVPQNDIQNTTAPGAEKPSEIKVTTNEAEVKTVESQAPIQTANEEYGKENTEENTEDQIEKSEY